jgi:alkyldihydroxyacetonephosphate synthase
MTTPTPPSELAASDQITARFNEKQTPLSEELLQALANSGVSVDRSESSRVEHSRDWWPLSIGWAAQGRVPAIASGVVNASSTDDVAAVLTVCNDAGVPVTAVAGRSGVCGGSIPLHGGVALDLCGLNQILEVDEVSQTVTVQAGVFGPELEAHLAATGTGYTLGHWPQSFELSTVGGWLACRGAGQYSTRYGKIEDMVRGLTVVLADGRVIETDGHGPRSATGPSLTQLFVGSEGTLGIITQATFAIHHVAPSQQRGAWGFDDFAEGLDACRKILQRGATPAVLRLYDVTESKRTFDLETNVLIVLDEADHHLVDATFAIVREEVASAAALDSTLVDVWLKHRNDVSALAPLWNAKIVVDTIEMSGEWAALPGVCSAVLSALHAVDGTMVASVHQSHAYSDGACLYFTFAGRVSEKGDEYGNLDAEEAYYRACWDAATAAIETAGAAISHHHGIGMNRGRFLASAMGASFGVLQDIKTTLDPNQILNPGKLGLNGGGPW